MIRDTIKRKKIQVTTGMVVVALFLILCTLFLYMQVVRTSVERNTIETMRELADHDSSGIQGENEHGWEDLRQIIARLKLDKPKTVSEVIEHLNKEASLDRYESAALVSDEGKVYFYSGLISDGKGSEPVERILDGEKHFAINQETANTKLLYRDKLVQGISFNPYEVDGVTFVGIYVVIEISAYEAKMELDSFGASGETAVFDNEGYYVVKKHNRDSVGGRHNFYEQLRREYKCTDEDITTLRRSIEDKEAFEETMIKNDGTAIIMHFHPIEETEWTMVLEVPTSSVSKTTRNFANQTFKMMVVIAVIMVLLMFMLLKQSRAAINAKAEATARAEFLANMSHEIRTPLNGIIGLNHLMKANVDNKDKLAEYLEKSERTEKYLLSLINDILDLQKLQAGKIDVVKEPFSVSSLTDVVATIIRSRMEDKNIDFHVYSEIVHDTVVGDNVHIQQILMNILGNAAKFTDRNGKVEMRVIQTDQSEGAIVTRWEIEDNGCGMSEEYQKKIFESFSQERNAITNSIKGTGLGMSISSMLSEAMGGSLTVASKLGEGSCFTFELKAPIAADVDAKDNEDMLIRSAKAYRDIAIVQTDKEEHEVQEDAGDEALTILVADDNELNAEILKEILEMNGHTVDVAVDGVDVIEKFKASPERMYDLILMDIQMPKHIGYEATKIIRALDRDDAKRVLIFACTANTFQDDVDTSVEAGMDDFIGKPIDVDILMNKLKARKERK